jgi:hypothetical protein
VNCFDLVYFLTYPQTEYLVHFLEPVPTAGWSSYIVVANSVKACSPTHNTDEEALVLLLSRGRWPSLWSSDCSCVCRETEVGGARACVEEGNRER